MYRPGLLSINHNTQFIKYLQNYEGGPFYDSGQYFLSANKPSLHLPPSYRGTFATEIWYQVRQKIANSIWANDFQKIVQNQRWS